jgi:hypothetical protein
VLADRRCELVERGVVHLRARLVSAGLHTIDCDRLQRIGRIRLINASEQRIETAAESFGSNHRSSSSSRDRSA